MKTIKIVSVIVALAAMFLANSVKAQDIHFSQFYMNPLQQNPAMAGAVHGMEANINYKDQWRAVGAPYKTFALGYHMRYEKKRSQKGFMAGGVNFFHDRAGDSKMGTGHGNLHLAYHVKLNEHNRLGGGASVGYFQRSIDYTNLKWATQFDGTSYNSSLQPGIGAGQSSFTRVDVGAGLAWVYNNKTGDIKVTDNHDLNFVVGFSVQHLNRPKFSFLGTDERLPMKVVGHGNGVISISDSKWAFCPGFMYYRQGPAQEIYVGTLFRYLLAQDSKFTGFKNGAALYFGGYFRTQDAVTAKLILEYAGWGFGVSYDVNISSLAVATNTRGGLELSLRWVAPNPFMKTYGADHSRY